MALETLVGLNVTDEESYKAYRAGMIPILEQHQGSFGYDFTIAEVLKSRTNAPINRLFMIVFPNADKRDAFFSNAEYLEVRKKYFEPAVGDVTMIAAYETEES